MKKPWLILVFLGLLGSSLVSCNANGTPTQDPAIVLATYDKALEAFNQIYIGMPYEQVNEVVGFPGVERKDVPTPASDEPGIPDVPQPPGFSWYFSDNSSFIHYFYGTQRNSGPTGLKTFGWDVMDPVYRQDAISSEAQYDQVAIGMTYDEVKTIMGSPGRIHVLWEGVRLDKVIMGTSAKGFPSMTISTKVDPLVMHVYWWTGTTDHAKTLGIGFSHGVVSSK
jgi:outer membrane protein assembly factor BamE (lipoprotein component of BamABCDE complex)